MLFEVISVQDVMQTWPTHTDRMPNLGHLQECQRSRPLQTSAALSTKANFTDKRDLRRFSDVAGSALVDFSRRFEAGGFAQEGFTRHSSSSPCCDCCRRYQPGVDSAFVQKLALKAELSRNIGAQAPRLPTRTPMWEAPDRLGTPPMGSWQSFVPLAPRLLELPALGAHFHVICVKLTAWTGSGLHMPLAAGSPWPPQGSLTTRFQPADDSSSSPEPPWPQRGRPTCGRHMRQSICLWPCRLGRSVCGRRRGPS